MQVWALEEGMATHSNILAWRIPLRQKPGGLQFIGLHRPTWPKQLSMHILCLMLYLYPFWAFYSLGHKCGLTIFCYNESSKNNFVLFVGNLLVIVFVSYFGAKLHRPKIIGIGCIIMGTGSILTALPHFFMG